MYWSQDCLELLIKEMPYVVFKHVFHNNRYMMLYNHYSLMKHAVQHGQLDMYKLLETQALDHALDILPIPYHSSPSYYLILALNHGQASVFNYLLSFETKQSMENMIQGGKRTLSSFLNSFDKVDMSSLLKSLITFVETHYNTAMSLILRSVITFIDTYYKMAPSKCTPSNVISQFNPFAMLLICQDIGLAQLAIKYVEFDANQLYTYCNFIFGHDIEHYHAHFIPSGSEIDVQELKHTVEFLFALLKLYGRHVECTKEQLPRCLDVLTEFGVLITDIFVIMSSQNILPPIRSYIRRDIFTNIRQDCSDHSRQMFIQFFMKQSYGHDGQGL
ncbi:hypothetical protein SAMD00019534_058780 [Acytostelium subglobosum LB1]|uniref:hypothetical protein n=1 Tax=Acytostelium subglobosum LB1 TaxID=1410327 RepID=UPI0006448BA9|nr:hypothetical protein SAMD00019534_058780 [Acytostelium subglobosum LB1]GAM22703.1 hypothetical protein SAMD00019534_058780 [Acytostelium subglobosum LB1]|eukprot:XP_012753930.1 hypothetical protein SAMD00019534_058780 [Acytostelium subglobosum LB1]